jgi:hypothetical protein
MKVPLSWHPLTSFPMQLWYGQRRQVQLWTHPAEVDEQGRVLLYLAAGPAGTPVMAPLVTRVFHRPLPAHSRIRVITDVSRDGQVVFGEVPHTAN